MRTIPEEVQTLLKSRSMIGENRPNCEVSIGAGGYSEPVFPTIQRGLAASRETEGLYGAGNWAQRADGKTLYTYPVAATGGYEIWFAVADSDTDMLAYENFIPSLPESQKWKLEGVLIKFKGYLGGGKLHFHNGELLLYVVDAGILGSANSNYLKVYKSANGLGTDFNFFKTLYNFDLTTYTSSMKAEYVCTGEPCDLSSGRIVMYTVLQKQNTGTYATALYRVFRTDDNWETFNYFDLTPASYNYVRTHLNTIAKTADDSVLYILNTTHSACDIQLIYSTDQGATWSNVGQYANEDLHNFITSLNDGYIYLFRSFTGNVYNVYRRPDTDPIPLGNPVSYQVGEGATWGAPWWSNAISIGDEFFSSVKMISNGHVCFSAWGTQETIMGTATGWDGWFFADIERTVNTTKLPTKSINISRSKNMAGALEVVADNKGGLYSPDNTGTEFENLLWPNTTVTVNQGYGTNLIKTFTGLIDRIEMSTFPQEIRLSVRDNLKLALDQIISMPWEGGTSHNITYWDRTVEWIFTDLCAKAGITTGTIEATGITINEKTFSWETYADCFSWLAEICGFEYGADEEGLMYFRKDTVPADPTVAYIFKEGEDIISLGYIIDDDPIYYKVAVYGKAEDGHVVFAARDYVSRSYYNVLAQKFLKIDAPEARTVAECQAIADQAEALMRSRVRTVNFAAIAVPWLQVGDFIQVTESSTTISEIYRITDLSTTQNDSGYTMQITCYHYSA